VQTSLDEAECIGSGGLDFGKIVLLTWGFQKIISTFCEVKIEK
jgi:hypothetical protein